MFTSNFPFPIEQELKTGDKEYDSPDNGAVGLRRNWLKNPVCRLARQVPLGFWVKLMEIFYLSHEFENLAQPENDTLGASLEIRKPILRVRKRQDTSLDQSLDLDI
jgi:hypothetical protein